ncbi:MAG: carbohydrate binding domain-containing protein [Oscillospiraceae bacterium]|nr:carbohydrate binding domain-containing protein [Oscillospiraceae bacterium]
MKTAKKLICMLLAMSMLLAFAACKSEDTPSTPSTPDPVDPVVTTDDPVTTDEPVETTEDPLEINWPSDWIDVGPFSIEPDRILLSSDFDNGTEGWTPRCGGTDPNHNDYGKYEVIVETTMEEARSPSSSLKVSGRFQSWNGATIDITDILDPNILVYEVLAWVKVPADTDLPPGRVNISMQTNVFDTAAGQEIESYDWLSDYESESGLLSKYLLPVGSPEVPGEEYLTNYPEGYVTDDGWVLLRGLTPLIFLDEVDKIQIYIENSSSKADFYIDSFWVLAA